MRGGWVALWVVAGVVGAGLGRVHGEPQQPPAPQAAEAPGARARGERAAPLEARERELAGRAARLAARERELAGREARLEVLERELEARSDEGLLARAAELGVVEAVRASRLPERQQRRLAATIVREAERHGLDPLLVVALIRCESSFNNYAKSSVGALGLMQVMPDTGKYLAERAGFDLGRPNNLYDPETNVELGTAYLASLIQRFGSLEGALVAYNAGPGSARRILAQPEARRRFVAGYPAKVVAEFERLKQDRQRALSQVQTARGAANPG